MASDPRLLSVSPGSSRIAGTEHGCPRRSGIPWAFSLLLSLSWAHIPGSVLAQAVIPDDVSCLSCEVMVEPVARLALEEVPDLEIVRPPATVTDNRGNHWLIIQPEGRMVVFDSTGAFLRSVGGLGEGQGQFRWPSAGVAVGDSVVIFDDRNRRAVVFGPDFQPRRSISLSEVRSVLDVSVLHWPDRVLLNAEINTPDRVGLPLHLVGLGGHAVEIALSSSLDDGRYNYLEQHLQRMVLANSRQGQAWVAGRYRYRISRWDTAGRWIERFERHPVWFEGISDGLPGGPDKPPSPEMAAVREDSSGHVWVFVHVPDLSWPEAWADWEATRIWDPGELYRTLLEVVDPQSGRVQVRHEYLDGALLEVIDEAHVMSYKLTPDGERIIQILRITIDGG